MKRIMAIILLWTIFTVCYLGVIVGINITINLYPYPYSDSDFVGGVCYGAYKTNHTLENPPAKWYEPSQLGIFQIVHFRQSDPSFVYIVVLEEPFPLQERQLIFKYKDSFYQISPLWNLVKYDGSPWRNIMLTMFGAAIILVTGWIVIGYSIAQNYFKKKGDDN